MFCLSQTVVSFPKLGLGPWTLEKFLVKDLFGKLSVAWYGAIICVGMLLACAIALYNAKKREGFDTDSFLDYFVFTIPIGVVGARLMYVLANLDSYESFSEAVAVWEGGLAIYGGVLAGAATVFVISKIKKQRFFQVADTIIPGLFLAQSLGRWGNFVNGEAHGGETELPWGMSINGAAAVHPTFLYESLITLAGFCICMFMIYPKKKWDGQILSFYMLWYGVGRTLVESLRTDSLYIGPLKLSQCIGVATALCGVFLMICHSKKEKEIAAGDDKETSTLFSETKEEKEEKEEKENGTDH
ncbi:MAG: prolipoprotein diacylglyceryl transferase [Clostridia bacterium]|nr:prolipoprotein diacylglyceryl transferase [Clostridia bacterium]